MHHQKFVSIFRDEITKALSARTNWGRNQLNLVIEKAIATAATKTLDGQG